MCKYYSNIETWQVCGYEHNKQTNKSIDWTKPIQNLHNLSNKVRVVGQDYKGNIVVEQHFAGTSYFEVVKHGTGKLASGFESSNFLLANIPEPKKEQWVNVYFIKATGIAYSTGARYGSKAHANGGSCTNGDEVYCGAFQVE